MQVGVQGIVAACKWDACMHASGFAGTRSCMQVSGIGMHACMHACTHASGCAGTRGCMQGVSKQACKWDACMQVGVHTFHAYVPYTCFTSLCYPCPACMQIKRQCSRACMRTSCCAPASGQGPALADPPLPCAPPGSPTLHRRWIPAPGLPHCGPHAAAPEL